MAITRYTMTSAEKSVIPEFVGKLEMDKSPYHDGRMVDDFELKGTTFLNSKSGSEVSFMGLKTSSGIQTASLKSIEGLTTWLMEEAEELVDDGTDTEECTFDKIDNSIRTIGKDLRTILLWNPTNVDSFVYKRFFEEKGVDITFNGIKDGILYIYTTYLDNIENLDTSVIEKAEKKRITPPGALQFDRERALGGVAAGEIEGAAAQYGDVGGTMFKRRLRHQTENA